MSRAVVKREGLDFVLEKKRIVKVVVYQGTRECLWEGPLVCFILFTKVVNYIDVTMVFLFSSMNIF